jgi:phosphoglycolate phosphatase
MTHLFFDLDGTLTDPAEGMTKCMQYSLEKLGRISPEPPSLLRFIGQPLKDIFSELLSTDETATIDLACQYYRERFARVGLFENRVYDDIPLVLEALIHDRYLLWLVTAKPTPFAIKILEHFDLLSYFKGVYGSELDGSLTEKTDIITHILASETIQPDQAIMIGDRDMDVIGARNNGLRAIAVSWGFGTQEELEAANPTEIINSPLHLLKTLQS